MTHQIKIAPKLKNFLDDRKCHEENYGDCIKRLIGFELTFNSLCGLIGSLDVGQTQLIDRSLVRGDVSRKLKRVFNKYELNDYKTILDPSSNVYHISRF